MMTRLERWTWTGLTGVVVFFAVWGLAATFGIAMRAGLDDVSPWLLPAMIAGIAAAIWEWRRALPIAPPPPTWQEPAPAPAAIATGLAVAGAMAALPFAGTHLVSVWGAVVLLLGATLLLRKPATPVAAVATESSTWLFPAAVASAIAITLLSNRPQSEDHHYLWMILRLLHHPDQAIYNLLTVLPGRAAIYAWHPREVLMAGLQRTTGIAFLVWYYYFFPILHALAVVAVLYLTARRFAPRDAAAAAALGVLLLGAWGESHATLGNFAFVRLFHGQAVIASWAAPAAFLFGLRFGRERNAASFLMVCVAVISAYTQWHTGAVVAPLAALIGMLAAWPIKRGRHALMVGMGFVLVGAGGYIAIERHLIPHVFRVALETAPAGFQEVFPRDLRSSLALALAALAGLALRGEGSRLATRTLFFGLILAANPFVMEGLAHAIESLSFRILGAVPFTLLFALGLIGIGRWEMERWRFPMVAAVVLAAFLGAGRWTTALDNGNAFGNAGFKISPPLLRWIDSGVDTPPSLMGSPLHVAGWSGLAELLVPAQDGNPAILRDAPYPTIFLPASGADTTLLPPNSRLVLPYGGEKNLVLTVSPPLADKPRVHIIVQADGMAWWEFDAARGEITEKILPLPALPPGHLVVNFIVPYGDLGLKRIGVQ